ncbi:tetratricopeptide repeat-containing family protein [Dorcoceras hygrometricum]|uniref:Tetratricopeptide repeat-containing family protein n=1 Tax=Dorcoceras hygrometricum TaxID=472368 RepID=A0A2Z7BFY4_9LAMI|nr:tetratricopeptide repeat-containing family protein [Dorcoceras hygrometricum]
MQYLKRAMHDPGTMKLIRLLGIRIRPPLHQSGPRPDSRLLRQTALEVLTRSARSDSPRKTRPERNSGEVGRRCTAAAAAAAWSREEREGGG